MSGFHTIPVADGHVLVTEMSENDGSGGKDGSDGSRGPFPVAPVLPVLPAAHNTSLYPTPCTVMRCRGSAGFSSSFALSESTWLSTVRVVG